MAEDWLTPKDWKAGETLLPSKLNIYIGAQNDFLRYRNRAISEVASANAVAVTALAALNDSDYRLTYDVKQNEDVLINLEFFVTNATINAPVFFDIFVDDTYYLSSGLGTALTRGMGCTSHFEVSQLQRIAFRRLIRNLSTGQHTFSVHAARTAGTVSVTRGRFEVEGV